MQELPSVQAAKASFQQSHARMLTNFAATPEDRLHWSPSPTARTAVALLAHSAGAIHNIHQFLQGNPFPAPTPAQADAQFRAEEDGMSAEDAMSAFQANSASYLAWLDTLTAEDLERVVLLPFDLGSIPIGNAIGFPAMHMDGHIAQLEYLQTIYGDRVWH